MKKSFETKVLEFLKGGDEAKIAKFKKELLKHIDNQIKLRNDIIEKLRDKLAEQEEKKDERILSVNLDLIKTSDDREVYIPSYVSSISKEFDRLQELNEEIDSTLEEIEKLKLIKTDIE